ncbi:MAG TPA: universal stress protein [Malonomonas sp.]
MSIKHLFVHLDHTPQSRSRLEFAIGLAGRQQAFLTGCYAADSRPEAQAQELQATFVAQTANRDIPSQWLSLEESGSGQALLAQLCHMAQCSDLVIIGQPDPKNNLGALRELPEKLVLHSGRPVLILPYAGSFTPHCERVMVAWNGGRESVRALHDALPLLQQARKVSLLSLIPAGAESAVAQASLAMLCQHLALHGIQAHSETQVCLKISKGDLLLNRSAEEGISLLIAGGVYRDHLGEVANHLLKYMTIPVLMSH